MERFYLDVPFEEKDRAKRLGAKWDWEKKQWYFTDPEDKPKFKFWLLPEIKTLSVEDLSDEQRDLITHAAMGENILVDACIGSGKTTAIQVLCNQHPDKKILYLTYNTLLKLDAKNKIRNSNTTVTNYHGFAYGCLKEAGIQSGISDLIQNFLKYRPLTPQYDMLVLDEYQDIELEIAQMLEIIKRDNPNIQIIAVGDMQQKIYDKTTLNVPEFMEKYLGEYTQIGFTKCFRLNADIARQLGHIWEKRIDGVNPHCSVEFMTMGDAVNFIAEQDPGDILCLGSRTGGLSTVLNLLESRMPEKFNKNTVYASIVDEDRSNRNPNLSNATFTTFDSAKGLERRFCIVLDFTLSYWEVRIDKPGTKYEILRNIFCVAASRGKEKIIFVKGEEPVMSLQNEALTTKVAETDYTEEKNRKFNVSDMYKFRYKECVEACYASLDIKPIHRDDRHPIKIATKDGLVDLSPCIGIYQEAAFFQNYNIDDEIIYYQMKHSDGPTLHVPHEATMEKKVLILTAAETKYARYAYQVKESFVSEEHKEVLFDRLRTVFDGGEEVQKTMSITFSDPEGVDFRIDGRCDELKGEYVYELKFKEELDHEDFLQLAMYLFMRHDEKGIIWNVRNNEMYEVRIPNRAKFFMLSVYCISKCYLSACRVDPKLLCDFGKKSANAGNSRLSGNRFKLTNDGVLALPEEQIGNFAAC